MSRRHLLALFDDVDAAEAAINELSTTALQGFDAVSQMVVHSPFELPGVVKLQSERPVYVQGFTLAGALLGGVLGFLLVAGAQADFYAQIKGGKPIVPIPPDIVLTFELFILGGVLFTITGFLLCAGLPTRRSALYSPNVTGGQVGVLVNGEEETLAALKAIFSKHGPLEIQEELGCDPALQ